MSDVPENQDGNVPSATTSSSSDLSYSDTESEDSSMASSSSDAGVDLDTLSRGELARKMERAILQPSPEILENFVRRGRLSDDRAEDHGTAIEFFLFARHRDSDMPLLAHFGHRRPGWRKYFDTIRRAIGPFAIFLDDEGPFTGSRVATPLVLKVVQKYVEENQTGLIPATALLLLFHDVELGYDPAKISPSRSFRPAGENNVKHFVETLVKCGGRLASADTYDESGNSQLSTVICTSAILQSRAGTRTPDCPLLLLEAFMKNVPQAREAVNMAPFLGAGGGTHLHLAVELGSPKAFIQLLIDQGADLEVLDQKGRTALDCAKIYHDDEDVQQLLLVRTSMNSACKPEPPMLDVSKKMEFLPKIYLPSAPDLKTSETNQVMFEYLRSELPNLLRMDPSHVVVQQPVEVCPYTIGTSEAKSWERGKETERRASAAVVAALKDLHDENPSLHIACFHDLRYGCRLPLHGQQWESDFDIAVFFYDFETGAHAVMLFEVKSTTRAKDIINGQKDHGSKSLQTMGGMGAHALDQLCKHIEALEKHINIEHSPEWIIPCLALPQYSTDKSQKGKLEENNLAVQWDEFIERAASCPSDDRMGGYARIQPKLLTQSKLEGPGKLKKFIEDMFNDILTASAVLTEDEKTRRKEAYSTLLAWCVAHCMGIALHHVSRLVDEQTTEVINKFEEKLALLTVEQKKAYKLAPASNSDPLLIVGAAGTGKTLLAVQKLMKCERDGLINEEKRGVFLTHKKNAGLVALVQSQLKIGSTEYIEVKTVKDGSLMDMLNAMKEKSHEDFQFCYVVLDQLEDMFEPMQREFPADKLLNVIMEVTSFEMFWVTINPFDVPRESYFDVCVTYLNDKVNSARCIRLDARIRNTTEISRMVHRCEMRGSAFLLSSAFKNLQPEQLSWGQNASTAQGVPMFTHFYEEDGTLGLGWILNHLLLKASVKDKHIVVITSDISQDEVQDSKKFVIQHFCQPTSAGGGRKPPSTAPLLVSAAWEGDIVDYLNEEELERVQEWFKNSLSEAASSAAPSVAKGSPPLKALRQCLKIYEESREHIGQEKKEGEGVVQPVADLFNSVAFQATLSLVRRYVTWAEMQNENDPAVGQRLEVLEGAIRNGNASKVLQDLIVKHRCISILDEDNIRGYEADVIILWLSRLRSPSVWEINPLRNEFWIAKLASRAKVMLVLFAWKMYEDGFKDAFPAAQPLKTSVP